MDAAIYKILKFLEPFKVGEFQDITPTLLSIYSGVDPNDHERVKYESLKIRGLMKIMEDNKLVSVRKPPLNIGSGNETEGYRWIDKEKYFAAMQHDGVAALEAEKNKSSLDRVNESIIETNKSTRDANYDTARNARFLRVAQRWSIGLSAASVIFIGISAYLQYREQTAARVQDLQQELQKTSNKLEQLEFSLKDINQSIQKTRFDTVFVKQK